MRIIIVSGRQFQNCSNFVLRLQHIIQRVFSLPPHVVARRIAGKCQHAIAAFQKRRRDKASTTYFRGFPAEYRLHVYLKPPSPASVRRHADILSTLVEMYLHHRFDLLGSGWEQIRHGMTCRGLEGHRYDVAPVTTDSAGQWLEGRINASNLDEARRIWSLIDKGYTPVDWHLDFKSGYRWSEASWYRDVKLGHKAGVDIKIPWELARMQHLPQFAWAYALSKAGVEGFQPSEIYVREFRNQVLDFIGTNPPRYGVNWACTMDVGIRVANWLIAYDLFRACGATFASEFEAVLARSVYEHGRHCFENMEYLPEFRSNHYLTNIAGLLFAAAYLPETQETDRWLAFALQELVSEMEHEFQPDGSNFEASTSYHRLATEIMLYCAMLCLRLAPERRERLKELDVSAHTIMPPLRPYAKQHYRIDTPEIFPAWFWERLERSSEFTLHITASNGEVPQFGDNDSGRFFKLWPSFHLMTATDAVARFGNLVEHDRLPRGDTYLDEIALNHGHLSHVAGVLFGRDDLKHARPETPETALVCSLLDGTTIRSFRAGQDALSDKPLQSWAYPDFGLYILRSPRLYLAIRCGSIGQRGLGGHAHNDQLSFELHLDGVPLVIDPGTYLYTADPCQRNLFRSTALHSTVALPGIEQHRWDSGQRGLFYLKDKAAAVCEAWEIEGGRALFRGRLQGYGGRPVEHTREVRVDLDLGVIEVRDTLQGDGADEGTASFITAQPIKRSGERSIRLGAVDLEYSASGCEICAVPYSPKYGMVTAATRIFINFMDSHTTRFFMPSSTIQGDR